MYTTIKLKKENPENIIKFAKIEEIVFYSSKIYFFCRILKANFDTHYHAFEFLDTDEYYLISTDEIHHYHPLSLIKCLKIGDSRSFVRPHCHIINY